MFLKSIKLRNFRCFAEHELSFVDFDLDSNQAKIRKTTILLGDNGTGKSNLLKAIALVTAGRDALAELLGDPKSWIQVGKTFCQLDAILTTAAGEERHIFLKIEREDSVSKVLDRAKDSLTELDQALEHTNRNYFILAYGASRQLNVNQGLRASRSDYSHVRARSVSTLFDPNAMLAPIESWAMDLDYQENEGALKILSEVLSEFLQNVSFSKIDKDRGQLIFKTPLGEVPMNQLSDGYQNIAAWIGDLLYQINEVFEDRQKPLKTRGLLLIDEVDLHLHPRWQRKLLAFLSKKLPNFQIVATTHSPITAQQANENELHYLERQGRSVKLHQFNGVPRKLLLHQLVMSDVFGLSSDESVVVEQKKARYAKLCHAQNRSKVQEKELERLSAELSMTPQNLRPNVFMSQEHLDLLQTIQTELEERRT